MKTDKVLATRPHKVIYQDGDKVWKVFDANYPKTDVLNEALNQARVEETGLPIPRVHGVKENGRSSLTTLRERLWQRRWQKIRRIWRNI